MAKHGFVDHKQTSSNKAPDGGYARIKAALDGSLQYILSNGVTKNISSPWELPTENYSVLDPTLLSPVQWERYLVPANAVNDWLGHDQDVAQWNGTTWEFVTPEKGWSTYLKSENLVYMFDGATWEMLSAVPTIEDILYDDFYDKILANALVPGKKYRITNFCSTNMVHGHHGGVYTSPPFMILTTAVSNNEISIDSVDLDNVFDEVYYDPDMTVPAYFWISAHPNNSPIDDEFFSLSSRDEVVTKDFAPYCECYFLSDHEVRLGTRTIVDSSSSFEIGNNGANTTVTLADPNVSWDPITGILSLSGGLNFIDSGGTNYYLSANSIRMASPERRYGVIYWRKNLEHNIEADLDWRHVHWRVYNTSLQYATSSIATNGYYSLTDSDFRVQNPDIMSHTTTATVDDTDYILKPMFLNCDFTNCSNLSFVRCKGIVFENMNNMKNLSMVDCHRLYFWNPVGQGSVRVANIKITESRDAMMFGPVKGQLNKEAKIQIESSIIDKGYYYSNTCVDTCLISVVNNVTLPRLASVNMDKDSMIRNVKGGDIASIQMYVTSALQCIIQDSDHIDIERSYINDATLLKFNNYGQQLSHCRFESNITNFNLTNNSIAFNTLINFINPIENTTYYGSVENIDFPEVYNSELKGNITTSFPKVINYDFISVDAAFTMPAIGLGVYLDSSGGSFDIELPAEPYVNQELTFVDAPGQCGTNSVNIVVSTAPSGGTVNTINGGTSKTIDISYGLLKLRYNTSSGWIVVLESIVQDEINADEMTITKQAGFQHRSDGNVLADDVEKYWLFGSVQNSIAFRDFIYHDGILYGSGDDWFWKTQSGNTTQFPAGTYEFYASIDLTPYIIYLENTSGPHAYFTSVYENGLYRHTTTLASSTLIDAFGIDSTPPHACSIWMIDRFYSGTSDQFSNKNIDLIINSNGVSIDGSAIISTDAKKELVTKDYVDKKTGKADEITLEQIAADIITDSNPDEQLIFNSAWDDAAQTSGWNLSTGITYLNGVMTVPTGTSVPSTGHLKIFDGTTPAICQETYMPFLICSHDQGGAGFLLTIDDDINNKQLRAFDISVLPNGKYKYSFYIPNGFNYSGISIHTGSSPTNVDFEIEFVDMDQYPPQDSIRIKEIDHIIDDDNESIDGSNTPMIDSHRELITRAYFHANAVGITDITYDDLMLAFDSSSLTTGQLYRITDFESLNRMAPDSTDIHSSGVLPLIVQAASINSIYSSVIDTVNEQDVVNYSFDNKMNIYHQWDMWNFATYRIVDDDGNIVPTNPPSLDNDIASNGVDWTLGTDIIVDMATLSVTADQGPIPNSDMAWNPVTGVLSIVSGSRRFDETHSMMGNTVGNTRILDGVKMVDPYKRFGSITYRKDTINNIEASFDFRYRHYYRYETDMSVFPFGVPANNVYLLTKGGDSHSVGPSGAGLPMTYYSLTSNANKQTYPAIDLVNGTKFNISMMDVEYTVIGWEDFYNVKLTSVKNSTFRNVNGATNLVANVEISNATDFYLLDGGGIRDSKYHYVRDHLSIGGMINLCEFTGIDQQTFYQYVQYVNADCTLRGNCINGGFSWIKIKSQEFSGNYIGNGCDNLSAEAHTFSNGEYEGTFKNNKIISTGGFSVKCSGDFEDNSVSCGTFINVTVDGDFLRNIVSANWLYVNVQSVVDSKIDTHTEMTFSTQITETDDITFSAISVNANKTLNSYSMTYVLDTSGGSFDIELPENPSQNTHLVFIDELGNSGTNLVNINKSTSPAGGIINTLNGNSVDPLYVLNKDYSYIEMIYTDNGGWVLMKESQATLTFDDVTITAPANQLTIKNINYIIDDDGESIDGSNTAMVDSHTELVTRAYVDNSISSNSIEADDITIDTELSFLEKSNSQNFQTELHDNWDISSDTSNWETVAKYNTVDSVFQLAAGADAILSYNGAAVSSFTAGDYLLYTTIDITPYNIYIWDNVASSAIYSSSITYVNGLYLVKFTLAGGEDIIEIGFDNNLTKPCGLWFVNKNSPVNTNEIVTIKNIDKIIDSDNMSIDGFITMSENSHRELPTIDYVNKKIGNADEITIEKIHVISTVSTQSDYNFVLNEAWSSDISTTNWSIGAHCSYTNGQLFVNIPSGTAFEDILITTSPLIINEGIVCKFVSDLQLPDGTVSVLSTGDLQSWQYDEKLLSNGSYEYSLYIPSQTNFEGLHFNQGMATLNCTLTFYMMDLYPVRDEFKVKNINYIIDDTNQSIDGSNTPMVNSHTELPTRAYVDTNIANSTNWMKTGTQLEPSDPLVESILIDNNHNGYNIITLENTNTGNGAGGVFEAHKSNTAYQDNIYMGIYSDNFWLTDLAGKGVVFTDQDLVIGTVDNTKNINFLVGNSYTAPVVVGHLNQDGLHLDTIMTTSVHPASYHNLFVDANTGLIYASSTGTTGDSPQTDRVVVNGTMVSNKTFTLTQTYNVDRQIYVYQNGLLLEDVYEWTISSNVITFTEVLTPLTINDRIVIKYYY